MLKIAVACAVFIIACYFADIGLTLTSSPVKINESGIAEFNCSYNCVDADQTYTIFWFVGDGIPEKRFFLRGTEAGFTANTGLHVDVENISTCDRQSKRVVERLRIIGSSAELYNRTAVQCLAVPRFDWGRSVRSPYSMMLIYKPASGEKHLLYS